MSKQHAETWEEGIQAQKKELEELKHTIDEDEKWLGWIQNKFAEIAGQDEKIDLQEFKGALKIKKSFFAERFFSLFDKDKSGTIELNELMDGLHMLTKGSPKEKLKFLFDVYDADGNGYIDPDELKIVLKSCMDESSLNLTEVTLDELTMTLFESIDTDDSGEISFEELVEELERHPGLIQNITFSAANWIKPPETQQRRPNKLQHRYFSWNYINNNLRKVLFLIIYFLINVALFIVNVIRYRSGNWCIIIARGCGNALNFNCAFVLVLMLRNTLTWLRSTRLGNYLPLDQSILLHKIVGYVITILTLVHTVAHLGDVGYILVDNNHKNYTQKVEFWEYLFTLKGGVGWLVGGFAYIAGDILFVILLIMVLCSLPCVRRSGYFEVFYWSHLLYILFWILLILHGPIFWYFFIIPGTIFVIEKIMNSKLVKLARYGNVYIKEVNLLPSKVTHLVIARPDHFHYKAGDYIFINIPDIAQNEWHPFTISSAPEIPGEVWLHVRSMGNWTNRLYEYFDKYESVDNDVVRVDMESGIVGTDVTFNGRSYNNDQRRRSSIKFSSIKTSSHCHSVRKYKKQMFKKVQVRIYIDGPYGTASREIFDTEHAVLIGSGIGVTPFASILQSIMSRYNMAKTTCPNCDHSWMGQIPESLMKMKKLDFIWINRDQRSFEWFVSLLARLEIEQKNGKNEPTAFENFLEMQMYMTSALRMSDMKGMALQMAMEMMRKKGGKDLVTGLNTTTQPGRPNWSRIFDKIASQNKGKVKVFFCGSPLVAKTLKEHCQQRGFEFAKENF